MLGVHLDFSSTSMSELSSPEKVPGHLLIQDTTTTGDENLVEQKFESLLRRAVQEIHMDLKEFGKRLDQSLDEAAATVAPLAQTLAQLQEENKILKREQERLAKEVEVLCRAMGLQDIQFEKMDSSEDPDKTSLLKSPLGVPQGSVLVLEEFQSSPQEANCSPINPLQQDLSSLKSPSRELILDSQDFKSLDSPVSPVDLECYKHFDQVDANTAPVLPKNTAHKLVGFETSPEMANSLLSSPTGVPQGSVLNPQAFEREPKDIQETQEFERSPNASDNTSCESKLGKCTLPELASPLAPRRPGSCPRRSLSAPALVGHAPGSTMETEPIVASEPVFSAPPSVQVGRPAADLPNGSSAPPPVTATPAAKAEERPAKVTPETLAAIEDEELLDKMLDESKDFEERRLIRAAMRDLRKRKRDQREKERESRLQELRQQRDQKTASRGGAGTGAGAGTGEVVIRKLEKSADGNTLSQVTKTERFAQSDDGSRSSRSTVVETSYVQKTDRGTVQSKSYSYSSSSSSSTSMSSNTKKVGSVFDREDDSLSRGGGLAAMERRQAERRKELMRAQTMPKASSMQARKAMIERLDKDATPGSGGPGVVKINRVQRSTSFGVPNANSIKQMLLDWCRAKTRSYEHVNIQNFSSSWSNGMAFCALVHHFFPEAFDYSSLNPSERRHNFDLAFSTAEKMVDCPQLLDVDDMVKMREPDWKCVYTYLQEFYRGLVTKGLVKTRGNS
ncbi:hypothetical protein NL108_010051 [Boleophthalmus pectinirostris]|nr:hypothetical protein NL108_010051 [Boleophthalmus pectinirostris]